MAHFFVGRYLVGVVGRKCSESRANIRLIALVRHADAFK